MRCNSGKIDEKVVFERDKRIENVVVSPERTKYVMTEKKTSVNSRDRGIKDDILARSMYFSLELVTVGRLRKFR